jgi:hypothetical protein
VRKSVVESLPRCFDDTSRHQEVPAATDDDSKTERRRPTQDDDSALRPVLGNEMRTKHAVYPADRCYGNRLHAACTKVRSGSTCGFGHAACHAAAR